MKRIHEQDINTPEHYDWHWRLPDYQEDKFDPSRLEFLIRHIKNDDIVLELGAGLFGPVQYAFERTELKAMFTALDFCTTAREMVTTRLAEHPRRKTAYFFYISGDVRHTHLATARYDVVIAGELIEHMEEPAKLVTEMARLTKPGGWMVISTVNPDCENAKKLEYPEHLWAFTPEDLVALFAPYGAAQYSLVGDYHMVETRRAV